MTRDFAHHLKGPLVNITLPAELTCLEIEEVLKGTRTPAEVLPQISRRMKTIVAQALLLAARLDALQADMESP